MSLKNLRLYKRNLNLVDKGVYLGILIYRTHAGTP